MAFLEVQCLVLTFFGPPLERRPQVHQTQRRGAFGGARCKGCRGTTGGGHEEDGGTGGARWPSGFPWVLRVAGWGHGGKDGKGWERMG